MIRLSYNEFLEQGINLARSYAKYILTYKKAKKKDFATQLKTIRSKDLKKAASIYFNKKKYILLSIIPEEKKD